MNVLFIEDEPGIAEVVEEGFKKEGFSIDIAVDGYTGLTLATKKVYDLIILDYTLPLMNGKEVCQKLRAEGNNTPIVMLTVKCNIDDKVEMLNLGVDDYMTKPFFISELISRVKTIIRRCGPKEESVVIIDNLKINFESSVVIKGDQELKLTRYEFKILEYFARNRNKIISREELGWAIWGNNFDISSKTIKNHITKLRRKIEEDDALRLIHTSYGRGYVFKNQPAGVGVKK